MAAPVAHAGMNALVALVRAQVTLAGSGRVIGGGGSGSDPVHRFRVLRKQFKPSAYPVGNLELVPVVAYRHACLAHQGCQNRCTYKNRNFLSF